MPLFDEAKQKKKLTTLHLKEEEDLAKILSQKYGVAYIDLSRETIDTDALALLPEQEARTANAAVFHKSDKEVRVAVVSPNNGLLKETLHNLETRGWKPLIFMASKASLERAWDHYKDLKAATETESGVLEISGEKIAELTKKLDTLEHVRIEIENVLKIKKIYRITRTLETIVSGALAQASSDIHIEPQESMVRLRFRLDGVLTDIALFDKETYEGILARVKLTSGLKLNVKNAAQDGRFSVHLDNKEIEIRTSLLPGNYGESLVLRILDPTQIGLSLETLGIEDHLFQILQHEIAKPNGMLLNTGPTGSGKTTTLYAFLKSIHTPEIKIITIEDPVEYHLEGIVQTQVSKNYSFASGLRSTLRQDPDVIMVGEIRDEEVASTAVHAALTGHLVFSTLHTNNAAGAIPRMIDLGVDANSLVSALNVSMAQRLVRILNPAFKEAYELAGEEAEFVAKVLESIEDKSIIPKNTTTVYRAKAPEGELGYKGRIGVYEAIRMDEAVEHCVKAGGGMREITEAARPQKILTMHQSGVLKALAGVTTIEEVRRVIGDLE